jgi:hypothetical protein
MNRHTENSDKDPAQLEQDIDRTRASLGRTVDELEHRLSPGELVDQAIGMAREHGGEFATNLGRSVKNNPIPMLLTSVGLAWMMASSNEPRARTGDAAVHPRGSKESLSSKARSAGASVSGSARQARQRVGDTVGTAGERVRSGADRARSGFEHMLEEQPLVLGAMGVALGAALGAAFPRTESEDRLMGDARDSLVDQAKEKASEAYDEARDRAGDAAAAVQHSQQQEPPTGDTQWEEPRGTEH